MIERMNLLGEAYGVSLVYDETMEMSTAVKAGWMAWELMKVGEEVDVRDWNFKGFKSIPLGSYVEGLLNLKGQDVRKVGT
mmetsp:Transcript_45106/g.32970  ORF Transcript_45106/g.32970 Transcript_45106/m.32970 type:complete len:80 (+) Transcript_45106:105-344(+)